MTEKGNNKKSPDVLPLRERSLSVLSVRRTALTTHLSQLQRGPLLPVLCASTLHIPPP